MKQTVLDVLNFLFEQYLEDESDVRFDQETIRAELRDAGFSDREVTKAFDWLQGLSAGDEDGDGERTATADARSTRVYAAVEMDRLGTESCGFIMFLEHAGVLDARRRELVIDRLMALESEEVDLDQTRWVVLMVLFNQPGQEDQAAWLEDLILDESVRSLH